MEKQSKEEYKSNANSFMKPYRIAELSLFSISTFLLVASSILITLTIVCITNSYSGQEKPDDLWRREIYSCVAVSFGWFFSIIYLATLFFPIWSYRTKSSQRVRDNNIGFIILFAFTVVISLIMMGTQTATADYLIKNGNDLNPKVDDYGIKCARISSILIALLICVSVGSLAPASKLQDELKKS